MAGERKSKIMTKIFSVLPVRQLGKIIFGFIILMVDIGMVNISKRRNWSFPFPFSHSRDSFCNIIMLTKYPLQVIIQC